ncbi:MAG: malonate decarboxylase acyl carrier protein [Terrimicrobiaceae bacterium]
MEAFQQSYPSKSLTWPPKKSWALAGVVGSGNLEVLIEANPAAAGEVAYSVETSIPGFKDSWLAALKDFANHYAVGGTKITIHDQGAAPVVIKMRLRQALDLLLSQTP